MGERRRAFRWVSRCLRKRLDAFPQQTAVHFDLRFPFAAVGRSAAVLPREVCPCAGDAGQCVLGACQLNLQYSLTGGGAFGENIQNDLFAVDDHKVTQTLPVALL